MTSGFIPTNPSDLLGSVAMKDIVDRLESSFDIVVLDAPPLLPVTDAAVLSRHVGGVVLIVGSQKTRQQDVQKSLDALEMVEGNVCGVVLNRLPMKGPDAYAYSYYESIDEQSPPRFRQPSEDASLDRMDVRSELRPASTLPRPSEYEN